MRRAFLTAGFLPATTAQRTVHVGLGRAYATHWAAGLLTVAAIALLIAWGDAWSWQPLTLRAVIRSFCCLMGDATATVVSDFQEESLLLAAGILTIETMFVFAALVLTPWGAKDEPLRTSFRHALQRTWLHTPHAAVVVLLCGGWSVAMIHTHWPYLPPLPTPPAYPSFPRDPASPEWQRYDAQYEKYLQQKDAYSAAATRHDGCYCGYEERVVPLVTLGWVTGVVWWLWALVRWVGAPRGTPPVDRPPRCETCGYNLTAAPADGRCSECGAPVVESLGVHARAGCPWERREGGQNWGSWCRCALFAIRRPHELGRQLRISTPATAHRQFLCRALCLIFVVAVAGTVGMACGSGWISLREAYFSQFGAFTVLLGAFTVLVALLLTCSTAGAAAVGFRLSERRNLMPASMQVASYLGGYLVLWTIVTYGSTWVVLATWRSIGELDGYLGLSRDYWITLAWCGPSLLCLLGYLRLVAKGTAGAQYANR